jgi:pimeloyl-ACP methyl ester carboxylesterase
MNSHNTLNAAVVDSLTSVNARALPIADAHDFDNDERPLISKRNAHTKTVNSLHIRDWGTGEPVVFLASAMLPSDMWFRQMTHLVDHGYRCIAYDRRGHGRSADPGNSYDFDTLADDLDAIISTHDLQNVTLISHSAGSGELLRYLTLHGTSRIARLAFISPTAPCLAQSESNPNGAPTILFEKSRQEITADFPQWIEDNEEPFFIPSTSEGTRRWVKQMMLDTSLKAVLGLQQEVFHADLREDAKAVRLPTLVLHGTKDASAPFELTGKVLAELIPDARLVKYEDAPHGLPFTHAERLNKDLLEFIRE